MVEGYLLIDMFKAHILAFSCSHTSIIVHGIKTQPKQDFELKEKLSLYIAIKVSICYYK